MELSKKDLLNILDFFDKCKEYGLHDCAFQVLHDSVEEFIKITVNGDYEVFFDNLVNQLFLTEFQVELKRNFKINSYFEEYHDKGIHYDYTFVVDIYNK